MFYANAMTVVMAIMIVGMLVWGGVFLWKNRLGQSLLAFGASIIIMTSVVMYLQMMAWESYYHDVASYTPSTNPLAPGEPVMESPWGLMSTDTMNAMALIGIGLALGGLVIMALGMYRKFRENQRDAGRLEAAKAEIDAKSPSTFKA